MRELGEFTKNGIHYHVLLFETRFEILCGLDDGDVEILDLFEETLVDVLWAGFGEVDGGLVAEHVEVSGSNKAVSSLGPISTVSIIWIIRAATWLPGPQHTITRRCVFRGNDLASPCAQERPASSISWTISSASAVRKVIEAYLVEGKSARGRHELLVNLLQVSCILHAFGGGGPVEPPSGWCTGWTWSILPSFQALWYCRVSLMILAVWLDDVYTLTIIEEAAGGSWGP